MTIESGTRPAAVADGTSSKPRDVAAYLKSTRVLLDAASESRQAWVREIGVLMRADDPDAAERAIAVGSKQRTFFIDLRVKLAAVPAPSVCQSATEALVGWLDKHVVACDAMIEAGRSGELHRLRITQGLLAEARTDLSRFNTTFSALVQVLQTRAAKMKTLRKRPLLRWPRLRGRKS